MPKECAWLPASQVNFVDIQRPITCRIQCLRGDVHDMERGPCLSFQLDVEDDAGSFRVPASRSQFPATFDCRYFSISMLMTRPHSG